MFIVFILMGAVLCFWGIMAKLGNDGAVIVTGTVVASRRTVEYLSEEENENKSLFMGCFGIFRKPRGSRELVVVYRPIVRFTYLSDTREAVVDERYFIKPILNVSMEIAFFPEDFAHAWRPAKTALRADVSLVIGILFIVLGVFIFLGVPLPFDISLFQPNSLPQNF